MSATQSVQQEPEIPRLIHRDADIVVLDKPSGLATLADRSGAPNLWDALPDLLGCKPYLVHRLDKGTSGVMVVALNPATQATLTRAFNARQVRKFYLARVVGLPSPPGRSLLIDLPLRPGRKSRFRVAGQRADILRLAAGWHLSQYDGSGHESRTRLRTLATTPDERTSLVLLEPISGRTHQLRVHMSWIGHPILGDLLYGQPGSPLQSASRLELHCHRLVVPRFGSFSAPLPGHWPSCS
jgi:RluA family pseudouridine synthase